MTPAFLQFPEETPGIDSGDSFTVTPLLPFFMYDGGASASTSNLPLDGGIAGSVPVITKSLDGGYA